MATQYDQPIKDEIKRTSNDKEGIKKIVDMAVNAMEEVDLETDRLNEQRSSLMDIISNFNSIYQVLEGSVLLDSNQVHNLQRQPQNLHDIGFFREQALQEADRIFSHPKFEGKVTIENIESTLKNLGELPWKNPKNAIDTILTRSGKWNKLGPGLWTKNDSLC